MLRRQIFEQQRKSVWSMSTVIIQSHGVYQSTMVFTSDITGTHAIEIAALFCVMCDLCTVMNFLYVTF